MAVKKLKQDIKPADQFYVADDLKLQMSLIAMADKYSEKTRQLVYKTYTDPVILNMYRAIRSSGVFQHGSKDKSRRKIVEFPNGYVYDFIDTVLSELYGSNWISNNKAIKHELVRPWWVIEKL